MSVMRSVDSGGFGPALRVGGDEHTSVEHLDQTVLDHDFDWLSGKDRADSIAHAAEAD